MDYVLANSDKPAATGPATNSAANSAAKGAGTALASLSVAGGNNATKVAGAGGPGGAAAGGGNNVTNVVGNSGGINGVNATNVANATNTSGMNSSELNDTANISSIGSATNALGIAETKGPWVLEGMAGTPDIYFVEGGERERRIFTVYTQSGVIVMENISLFLSIIRSRITRAHSTYTYSELYLLYHWLGASIANYLNCEYE